jgi:two-component system nitrate/nitrite response regulator NarL
VSRCRCGTGSQAWERSGTRLSEPVIHVFLVGGVRVAREGIESLLGSRDEFGIVGSAPPDDDRVFDTTGADVFIVDAQPSTNLETVPQLLTRHPLAKVVALGVPDDEESVLACVEAGVTSFVLANEGVDALVESVHAAMRDEVHCSPQMAAALARRVAALAAVQKGVPPGAGLTTRELEVVELIDEGLSNKEIAHVLRIEVATVKNHVHNILEKLHVNRRTEAAARVRWAFRDRRSDRIDVLTSQAVDEPVDPRVQRRRFHH